MIRSIHSDAGLSLEFVSTIYCEKMPRSVSVLSAAVLVVESNDWRKMANVDIWNVPIRDEHSVISCESVSL